MQSGLLIRIGIDSASGHWNAPCTKDGRFCYVPIPEGESSGRGTAFDRDYSEFRAHAEAFGVQWPSHLAGTCHLDPDFAHLTYGDANNRGKRIREILGPGDFIVFWAGLKSVESSQIICSIIGFYLVSFIANATEIGCLDWHRNAHTRRLLSPDREDVVVFAKPESSGRLRRHIPIGGHRDRAQRIRPELLSLWGQFQKKDGELLRDGYIQLSGAPPIFRRPGKFLDWFKSQRPELVHANNI